MITGRRRELKKKKNQRRNMYRYRKGRTNWEISIGPLIRCKKRLLNKKFRKKVIYNLEKVGHAITKVIKKDNPISLRPREVNKNGKSKTIIAPKYKNTRRR